MKTYTQDEIKTAFNNYVTWINDSLAVELIDILDKKPDMSIIQNIETTRIINIATSKLSHSITFSEFHDDFIDSNCSIESFMKNLKEITINEFKELLK